MSEAEFTKLYKYFNERFEAIDREFVEVHKENDETLKAVDAYAKKGRNIYAGNASASS
jgi:hypothetical protein